MSNPFRITVPSATSTTNRSRPGRSLAEVSEQHEREHRQQQRQRNNRYYKKKKKQKPSPPKPYDWANHVPVGGAQWAEERAQRFPMIKYESYLTDSMTPEEKEAYRACLPRMSTKVSPPKGVPTPTEIALQRGWERHEEPVMDQNGIIFRYHVYWTHPKYAPMRFSSNSGEEEEPKYLSGYTEWYGQRYEIPIASGNDDPLGLAYNFEYTASGTTRLVSNEWHSFWDTRRGKRHAKYLDYVDRRKGNRDSFDAYKAQSVY